MDYRIEINGECKSGEKYEYTFQRTKVELAVEENAIEIKYSRPKEMTAEETWESDIVKDAVRKAMLVQIILYKKNSNFEGANIYLTKGEQTTVNKTNKVLIYSLFTEDIKGELPQVKKREFIEKLLTMPKTYFESGIASLYSYLYAKSKVNEEEKFTYYWRSFNGLYDTMAEDNSKANSESKKIGNWLYRNHLGKKMVGWYFFNLIPQKEDEDKNEEYRQKKERQLFHIIQDKIRTSKWTKESIRLALKEVGFRRNLSLARELNLCEYLPEDNNHMRIQIEGTDVEMEISLFGYLLAEFAYLCRCILFHASKPILLYCTADDRDLRCLQLCNILLEEMLDRQMANVVSNKIDKIKKSTDLQRNKSSRE